MVKEVHSNYIEVGPINISGVVAQLSLHKEERAEETLSLLSTDPIEQWIRYTQKNQTKLAIWNKNLYNFLKRQWLTDLQIAVMQHIDTSTLRRSNITGNIYPSDFLCYILYPIVVTDPQREKANYTRKDQFNIQETVLKHQYRTSLLSQCILQDILAQFGTSCMKKEDKIILQECLGYVSWSHDIPEDLWIYLADTSKKETERETIHWYMTVFRFFNRIGKYTCTLGGETETIYLRERLSLATETPHKDKWKQKEKNLEERMTTENKHLLAQAIDISCKLWDLIDNLVFTMQEKIRAKNRWIDPRCIGTKSWPKERYIMYNEQFKTFCLRATTVFPSLVPTIEFIFHLEHNIQRNILKFPSSKFDNHIKSTFVS